MRRDEAEMGLWGTRMPEGGVGYNWISLSPRYSLTVRIFLMIFFKRITLPSLTFGCTDVLVGT